MNQKYMFQQILDKIKPELEELEARFKTELMEIRAGRLSPVLIEDVKVDCFGSVLPLKQLGGVSISGKEIIVQLWDRSYVEGVVKAIEQKKIGVGIKIEGSVIYLSAPALTEESKKNMVKILNQKKEEFFQIIRNLRDKAWRQLQDGQIKKEISEDDKFRGKDKLEELVKKHREKIEEMAENKRKEIEE